MEALLLGSGAPGVRQEAMAEGLTALGYAVRHGRQSVCTPEETLEFDLVAVWGQKPPTASGIVAARQQAGRPVIIYDLPLLRWTQRDDGVGLYTERVGRAWDVPAHAGRLTTLGVTPPSKQRMATDTILILAQKPDDASHGLSLVDYVAWSYDVMAHLAEVAPNATVLWRPHPKSRTTPAPLGAEVVSCDVPLEEQLLGVGSAITYNSAAQYVCYAAGVPCAVWSRGERWPDAADAAEAHGRLAQASWNDWTLDELRTAEPWRVMLDGPPAPAPAIVPTKTVTKRKKAA